MIVRVSSPSASGRSRTVKIFETTEGIEFAMMDSLHGKQQVGPAAGVCNRLLLQNEYLAAENRVLRVHPPKRLRLSDAERSTLAEIGKRLGRKALAHVACVARPNTILAWYRRLVAKKFDGS